MHYALVDIVVGSVLVVSLLGVFLWMGRDALLLRGYEWVGHIAFAVQQMLSGEIFRDGHDLVISGTFEGLPTVVRFSDNENTPVLNIRVALPSTFTMWVVPRGRDDVAGRHIVPTQNSRFNQMFTLQTNDPLYVQTLVSDDTVDALGNLARSSGSFLSFVPGHAELSEVSVSWWFSAFQVRRYLEAFSRLAHAWESLPDGPKYRPKPMPRESHIPMRTAIVVGVAAILAVGPEATQRPLTNAVVQASSHRVEFADQALIPEVHRWRLATHDDFDRDLMAWARLNGASPSGMMMERLGERGEESHLYTFVQKGGLGRVVAVFKGRRVYDATFPSLRLVVKARLRAGSGDAPATGGESSFAIIQAQGETFSTFLVSMHDGNSSAMAVEDYRSLNPY
jgi:hypothetical protein